jgi:hypothetical protein
MPPMSQAQLDQIKALLDQLPPDQRAAAQQAMNAVTQSDSGGGMQTTINVKSLRVNTGPPPV